MLVICTDVEHGEEIDPRVVELSRGADVLVHDAQYTAEELRTHRGWGHSSFDQAMQVAEMAGVKHLVMTHHDPEHDDEFLARMEKLCQGRFAIRSSRAKEWKSLLKKDALSGDPRRPAAACFSRTGPEYCCGLSPEFARNWSAASQRRFSSVSVGYPLLKAQPIACAQANQKARQLSSQTFSEKLGHVFWPEIR